MFLYGIDHNLEILKFGIEGDGASRAQYEARLPFAYMVDQLFAVGLHLFACADAVERCGDVSHDAHVVFEYLLGLEDVRGAVQLADAHFLR